MLPFRNTKTADKSTLCCRKGHAPSHHCHKSAPVATIQRGRIRAAIWKNTHEDDNVFYSFTLERGYRDKDGKTQSTSSFALNDALLVSKVADQADTRIRELMDADYTAAKANEQEQQAA